MRCHGNTVKGNTVKGNTVKGNVVYVMGTGGIKLSAQILLV